MSRRASITAIAVCLFFSQISHASEKKIIVAAAISLKAPVNIVVSRYFPPDGTAIATNFAASGTILGQLLMGAPISVVIFADKKTMDEAVVKNMVIRESVAEFAENGIVLAADRRAFPGGGVTALATSKDIKRIATGNPDYVPLGRYVKDTLDRRGEWEPLKSRLILTANAEQSLAYLLAGEVDAALVFSTDAQKLPSSKYIIESLPGIKTPKYYIGITSAYAGDRETAALARHLAGADAAETLVKMGFGIPGKGEK